MKIELLLSIIFGILTLASFIFAIFQTRKAKKSEKEIIEIKKAEESYQYLKDKAFEYYKTGRLDDALDVFKKYLSGNINEKDHYDIIKEIFKIESKSIFGDFINIDNNVTLTNILILWFSKHKEIDKKPKYSSLFIELVNLYKNKFKKDELTIQILLDLTTNNYENIKKYYTSLKYFQVDNLNKSFQELLLKFCNNMLGLDNVDINIDDDDIPF